MVKVDFLLPETDSSDQEVDEDDAFNQETPQSGVDSSDSQKSTATWSVELLSDTPSSCQRSISACMIDPFQTLPIEVDEATNQLLHFYGQDIYWQTAYALSDKIKPSIKGSWEYQTGLSMTRLHTLMGRSALHQLRMNENLAPASRRALETAALKHQGDALAVLRKKVALGPNADRKEVLTACISLATFEQRYGKRETSYLHFGVARDIVRQLGFRGGLHDRLREEQALWFEGIYSDPLASFLWAKEDASRRFKWLKSLLKEVDRLWRDRHLLPSHLRVAFINVGTRLHFLCRRTEKRLISIYGDIDDSISQQRCVLIFVCIIMGLYGQVDDANTLSPTPELAAVIGAIGAYASWIEEKLVEHDLGPADSAADLLWIMLQNYRELKPRDSNDAEMQVLKKLKIEGCQWRACGIANLVKYFPEKRQSELKDWLLAFLEGRKYRRWKDVSGFAFNYVSDEQEEL
ncbi:hypothetical protein LTR10_014911 [Elasticomyces elasticus]|uniref:Uncharacterized protein n=1 Tax=Exophiala sideris TaxID=1016849 RepID=A0ABR0JFN1_9EURO|nr:hypothetical protein LTR10_014911 [Elasticomyces elasticus]KAK5025755.1 hypothetical protein LTS07_007959 [Exophiala sideris]KAK5033037.1 hypothetical protein LTR13_007002 [Exophiala sideris]KAK5063522.1 hypothetical protein LTR69_004228 [Exophiala sideris]KAK5180646.1 hypothetical protein LTR44_006960 [Eurotiomycetes sp. CCFEE 6388]